MPLKGPLPRHERKKVPHLLRDSEHMPRRRLRFWREIRLPLQRFNLALDAIHRNQHLSHQDIVVALVFDKFPHCFERGTEPLHLAVYILGIRCQTSNTNKQQLHGLPRL